MAVLPEVLMQIAKEVERAKFGAKGEIYAKWCEQLNLSHSALMKQLNQLTGGSGRKQRADKGKMELPLAEAQIIAAYYLASQRAGKQMSSLEEAVTVLRANGKIRAESVNSDTGEVTALSIGTIQRNLRTLKLHPEQLARPKPSVRLRSLHPNHLWQIDPSLCVLYYLTEQADGGNGLNIMDEKQFYKNKPANVKAIEKQRVWRYVITDHTSGVIYVEYVYGGETAENISNCFIHAMQEKDKSNPFHGVPKQVMLDPGSANTSKMFKHLCKQLGVSLIVNEAGNPRAKGQVEKGNDIVERSFESGLRFTNVSGLDELNSKAKEWMTYYNGKKIHSRTKTTRYKTWLRIRAEQLVFAPSIAICRELLLKQLEERTVSDKFVIKFGGREYDVKNLPDVLVGEKVTIGKNPYRPDCIQVLCRDKDDAEYWHVVEPVQTDEYGFDCNAAIVGESYQSHSKTALEHNRETLEKLAYQVEMEDKLKRAKRSNAPLFGGEINPYKHIEEHQALTFMPKRGQEHELTTNARRVEQKPVSLVEVAKQLKARFSVWNGKHYKNLAKHYPDGVPSAVLDEWLMATELPELLSPSTSVIKISKVA
ncbi:transposase family protein [Pasteurellaceae bacterium USgator11]|nr:transposase family protein [Pasteurellaceae bacterium USgator41]TNG98690.1 transposase family protein [Pasteurellaceae bacterium UScroc31]TNH00057.1 transposase family protein [Pasteurellaceae bacterium USgator11]